MTAPWSNPDEITFCEGPLGCGTYHRLSEPCAPAACGVYVATDVAVVAFVQIDTPEYRAYMALLACADDDPRDTCGASYVTRGHDPYATNCDRAAGHYPATPHEGDDPFGGTGRVRWRGGGSAAGDPLPYRDVKWI